MNPYISRVLIISAWAFGFIVLNFLAKKMMSTLPSFADSPLLVARHIFGGTLFYVIVCLYGVCASLYLLGIQVMPLAVVGVTFQIVGLLASVGLGVLIFGERLTFVQIIGVAACVIGAFLVNSRL